MKNEHRNKNDKKKRHDGGKVTTSEVDFKDFGCSIKKILTVVLNRLELDMHLIVAHSIFLPVLDQYFSDQQ